MKLEDCYLGMTVKHNYTDSFLGIKEGDKGDIEAINKKDNYIVVWGQEFDPANFSKANEFKVGDEVLIKHLTNTKVKVWGKRYDENKEEYQYAVRGYGWNDFCYESELSPLKNKDELEVGDKFIAYGDNIKFKVVANDDDKYYNQKCYFARQLDGKYPGSLNKVLSKAIKEVVYE